MVTEPVFKQLIPNSIHNFYFIFLLYLISKIYLLAPYFSKVAVFYSFSPPHLDVFVSIIWCVCRNGIYTEHVTLNTKHLNIPLNKALVIWPVNVKWKKQLGKNAVSLWSFNTFLRNVIWDVHTCSRPNKYASTPQKERNVLWQMSVVSSKLSKLLQRRCSTWCHGENIFVIGQKYIGLTTTLCLLMSPLWAPAFILEKSIFSCSISPGSFSFFRCPNFSSSAGSVFHLF